MNRKFNRDLHLGDTRSTGGHIRRVPKRVVESNAILRKAIADHLTVVRQLSEQQELLEKIANRMIGSLFAGGKVLWCGNGGSAADCQHLAAELVGRFRRERQGLASIALTTDTSIITAIANDYGYDEIFRRQVEALCAPGDVVVGISTSGKSRNVCSALGEAKKIGAFTVCFTGIGGGEIVAVSDIALKIASADTARVQEAHILAGHLLCDLVEMAFCLSQTNATGGLR